MSSGTEFNAQYGSWYQYAIDYLMVCLDGGGKGGEWRGGEGNLLKIS